MSKIIMWCRHPQGTWGIYHTARNIWVQDAPNNFWCQDPHQAMKFLTQQDATLCAEYLSPGVVEGVKCDLLEVQEV